jgi:hypothetical protein
VSENTKQRERVDRRRFLKGAATVAWAAPVIATLSTSPAYGQSEVCGRKDDNGNCPTAPCAQSPQTCKPVNDTSPNCKCA